MVSAPSIPWRILLTALPMITLARSLPQPCWALPCRTRFSTFGFNEVSTDAKTVSMPSPAFSSTVSLPLSTKYVSLPKPPYMLSMPAPPSRTSLPSPPNSASLPPRAREKVVPARPVDVFAVVGGDAHELAADLAAAVGDRVDVDVERHVGAERATGEGGGEAGDRVGVRCFPIAGQYPRAVRKHAGHGEVVGVAAAGPVEHD